MSAVIVPPMDHRRPGPRMGAPPPLVRQKDCADGFVGHLVDSSAHIVEAIWPLSSVASDGRPGLPLRAFIQETLRRSRTSYSTLQVALYYLYLVKEYVPRDGLAMSVASCAVLLSGRHMFLAALIVASKYLQDRNFSARAWSKISGLSTSDINRNEITLLFALDWSLHVTNEVFQCWTEVVHNLVPSSVDRMVPLTRSQPPSPPPSPPASRIVGEGEERFLNLTPGLFGTLHLLPFVLPIRDNDNLYIFSATGQVYQCSGAFQNVDVATPEFLVPENATTTNSASDRWKAPPPTFGLLPSFSAARLPFPTGNYNADQPSLSGGDPWAGKPRNGGIGMQGSESEMMVAASHAIITRSQAPLSSSSQSALQYLKPAPRAVPTGKVLVESAYTNVPTSVRRLVRQSTLQPSTLQPSMLKPRKQETFRPGRKRTYEEALPDGITSKVAKVHRMFNPAAYAFQESTTGISQQLYGIHGGPAQWAYTCGCSVLP